MPLKNKILILLLFSIVMISCAKNKLEPLNYIHYIEDEKNNLKFIKIANNYLLKVQYKPSDYVSLLELRKESISKRELDSMNKAFGELYYFTLSITDTISGEEIYKSFVKSSGDEEKYLNYFSFDLQNHLKMLRANDTCPCVLFHYERSFSISPENRFTLGFECKEKTISKTDDLTLLFQDTVLKCNDIDFTISKSALKKIPEVQTQN